MSVVYNGHTGSRLLEPVASTIGLPLDQVNFIACQLFALGLAAVYRQHLSIERVSVATRHVFQFVVGAALLYFCFGNQTWLYIGQTATCFLIMHYVKPGHMEKAVFIVSLGYLCVTHIYRMIYDYGAFTLDITGALMLNTQRLSSIAYGIKDGMEKDESKLSENMKKRAIRYVPTPLEFLSYIFSFHGVLVGPFTFFDDYMAFIEGKNIQDAMEKGQDVSPTKAVLKNLAIALVFALLTLVVSPSFPIEYFKDPEFYNRGFFYKMWYIVMVTSFARPKYYFAWFLGTAVNNNAGLGYNGRDEKGEAKWDLIDNCDIMGVEASLSFKVLLDSWNIQTIHWLRYTVYERVPYMNTLAVFTASAFWHGFYPGYYLTFASGALFTMVSRTIRRNIRPWFQTSEVKARVYDVITFTFSRIILGYTTMPFVLLELVPPLMVYSQVYFCLHVLGGIVLVALPMRPKPKEPKKTE